MKIYCTIDMDIGPLTIGEENGDITDVFFGMPQAGAKMGDTPVIRDAVLQLVEYFFNGRQEFDLPLAPVGTEFQVKVWDQLKSIPYGETRSYSDIAAAVGNQKAVRAVASAIGKNPISIIVPCHRVISANGDIGGYAGGVETKRYLLALEAGELEYSPPEYTDEDFD